ncbi:MAG: hypothetical protein J6S85_26580 [Methanobrevibacter sp.]|nr:hypothetical protein [Methanobrevibacter sp.]MBO7717161.1 hypothetical protein [Methanobrevibacter sp.]
MAGNFFNEYPYTDFHELNLDWILSKMRELEERVANIKEDILALAKAYTDEQCAIVQGNVNTLSADLNAFKIVINDKVDTLNAEVVARLDDLDQDVLDLYQYIDNQIVIANARTDQAIINAKEDIYEHMMEELGKIKVINYFTGDLISVQEMFNYLASLHATDGITYTQLEGRNKTYSALAALNVTYTDIVMHGNTLIV